MFSSRAPIFIKNCNAYSFSNINSTLKLLILLPVVLSLSACQTYDLKQQWPPEMPERQLFVSGYLMKRNLSSVSDEQIEYHLGWVKKFYQGTTLYPNGWLRASSRDINSIQNTDLRKQVSDRMVDLGVDIANEWAQENGVRKINSTNIATWGSAMRTAATRNEQLEFLKKVEKDVQSLVSGELLSKSIDYDRYFTDESFDDF